MVFFALIGFSTWAGVSEFDQVISGEAKVVPSQQLQTIQHFEGGIVKEIHVRSGMDVTLGQALISLDPLESGAEYQAKRSEFIQALIRVRRLSAEHGGVEPVFDAFPIGNDAGAVPFADRLKLLFGRGGNKIVEAAGAMRVLGGGLGGVVDDLELEAQEIGGAVLHAAVALLRDLPFKLQLEIEVVLFRDDVSAAFLAGFVEMKDAILE